MTSITQQGPGSDRADRGVLAMGVAADGRAAAMGPPADPAELRVAMLVRAIQHEIIPRLMLAHRDSSECLDVPASGTAAVSASDVDLFAKLVLAPDESLVQPFVDALRTRGVPVEAIYLDLLAPVARHLGTLWEQDLCDFTEVTLGLGRLQHVLHAIGPGLDPAAQPGPDAPSVLLLPAPGEQHTFGLMVVAEFFRRAGWRVSGGPLPDGDPVQQAVHSAAAEFFHVIGFSLAAEVHVDALKDCIARVRGASRNPRVGIIVGGPLFARQPSMVAHVQADAAATDGRAAPQVAKTLVRADHPQEE